jgi:type IV secretory pathway TrbL component
VSSTILNDIVRDYEAISTSWFSALGPIANKIFWILVAIQLTWSAIWWVIDREDGLAVVSSLLRQIVAIGFFYALLLNGGTLGSGRHQQLLAGRCNGRRADRSQPNRCLRSGSGAGQQDPQCHL